MNTSGYLERILGIICSVFDAYSAVLFLPGRNSSDFQLAAMFSLGDRIRPDTVVSPGKGLVGWILRNNQPLLINNFDEKKGTLGYYQAKEEAHIKAFMGCPLRGEGGALCLDSKRTYSFSDKDQKILHLFTDLILDIQTRCEQVDEEQCHYNHYQCLQLLYSLRKRFSRWSSFLDHYLELLSESSGFEYCFFAARDEFGKMYFLEGANKPLLAGKQQEVRVTMGSGLVGWVFKNGSAVFVGENESSGPASPLFGKAPKTPAFASVICMPLVVSRATRGVLGLSSEHPIVINDNLKNFIQIAADHLALFLENLYLRGKLRETGKSDDLQD